MLQRYSQPKKIELTKKVSEFITQIIQNIRNMENLLSLIYKEGKKKATKGATKEIYESISNSFFMCLEKALGLILFDNDTKGAWKSLSSLIIESLLHDNKSNEEQEKIENNNKEEEIDDSCIDYEGLNKEVEIMKLRLVSKGINELIKDRRYFLKKYPKVLVGTEFVEFLLKTEAKDVNEALEIGNKLIDFDYMHHVTDEHTFKNENLYYRFREDEEGYNKEDTQYSVANVKKSCEVGKFGYALVKGFQFWSRRYLVLRNDLGSLYFYDNESSIIPRKILFIDPKFSCSVKEIDDCKKGHYCFNITGVHESLTISTQRSVDQEQWIEALVACGATLESTAVESKAKLFWELSATDIDGKEHLMSQHKGKVVMVVNVATN